MMSRKSLVIAFVLGLLISLTPSIVAGGGSSPKECPKIADLQATHFERGQFKPESGNYAVFKLDYYGTTRKWVFLITEIAAEGPVVAVQLASNALPTLTGNPSPILSDDKKTWTCSYTIDHGYTVLVGTMAAKSNVGYAVDLQSLVH